MRVIEPGQHRNISASDRLSMRRKAVGIAILCIATMLALAAIATSRVGYKNIASFLSHEKTGNAQSKPGTFKTFKYFSPEDFQKLYEGIAYPNTQPISEPPKITGNTAADARIEQIAESRGYELHAVPVQPITNTGQPDLVEDNLLQPLAYQAWQTLKKEAQQEGIKLNLSSGYRSIDLQRRLFAARLSALDAAPDKIAVGSADDRVVAALHTVAPPGYSRHHTGYTMDLTCDTGVTSFAYTNCFQWIKANNYLKAKQAGLIPSYPEGATTQGPEPEPWEYVWVGVDNLTN